MANMQIGKLTVIGNKARMAQLSANVRKEIASNAAKVRWNKAKHECTEFCKCITCGGYVTRHNRYSECKTPLCSVTQKIPTSTKNI